MSRLKFRVEAQCGGTRARAGRFKTLHSEVITPVFMPVGTRATVKSQTIESLKATGAQVLLANTYHLLLRPGPEVFRKFGGIHRFMNWDGSVLTDSGGFQIFSLHHAREMTEEGARFQSYIDGKSFFLSPELSIETQKAIGSDIMMVLDQCIASTAGHEEAKTAMELTHRWALRSLAARGDSPQALFGIVQGACHHDLRRQSAEFLREQPFDGMAIGGLAVGETSDLRYEFTGLVAEMLPDHLPRYLMGVGTPLDILEAVHRGVDMFDCIIPSQLGHRGTVHTSHGKMQMRRSVYKFAEEPLDSACDCLACRNYSRAYLHHLIKSDEPLGWHLLVTHNLAFYHRLMAAMREHIFNGTFVSFYEKMRVELARDDEDNPGTPPRRNQIRIPRLGDYEVHFNPKGFASIKQISSGEIMHSVNPPAEEAEKVYIEQSHLAHRLLKTSQANNENELVVWDVGLGAASNAMAAVRCFEKLLAEKGSEDIRRMRLISFECDLDPLALAFRNNKNFPHLFHGAPAKLLEKSRWEHSSGLCQWELCKGDFLELFEQAAVPDLVYFDPFSAKTDTSFWTYETFARLFKHFNDARAELYTYSTSTAIRAALLSAGFFVASGIGTGPKESTTIAFSCLQAHARHLAAPALLGQEWLARWRRSGSPFPRGLVEEDRAAFGARLEKHVQFA
ncbi:MAG TPA: tRNA guanosine(34) transglycosylase Tgt [Candidatus Rifleibacterium sp.]|nr:tRNA guanosine(34) transglycosylase Tgt [Candidatus Rifleibacterium sp.]HPT48202.1 tRNA guanosine(34) transglycosylase Tgt [Candidatus Rifleibacterium sp.]